MAHSIRSLVLGAALAGVLSFAAGAATEEEAPRVALGQEAPDFTLPAAGGGEEFHLENAREQKDLVLVFFRGAW